MPAPPDGVDDAAPLLRLHERIDEPDRPHEAEQLGVELMFQGVVFQRREAARIHRAGVVHQNIDAAEPRLRGVDEARNVGLLRHVGLNRVNFAGGRVGERVARHIELCLAAATDHDPHALLKKQARGFISDAAAAAGHDGATIPDAEVHAAILIEVLNPHSCRGRATAR